MKQLPQKQARSQFPYTVLTVQTRDCSGTSFKPMCKEISKNLNHPHDYASCLQLILLRRYLRNMTFKEKTRRTQTRANSTYKLIIELHRLSHVRLLRNHTQAKRKINTRAIHHLKNCNFTQHCRYNND